MDTLELSGYILIVGFVLVLVASIVGPREVYTAPDSETRLEIIDQNQGRWTATNIIWAFGGLVTAAGLVLLSYSLRESPSLWLLYGGAVSFVIGAVAWAIFLYQRTINPEGYLYTTPAAPLSLVFAWATIAGLALYGAAFLQGSFPNWLGIVLLVTMGSLLIGLVFFFDVFYASFPPQLFYLLTLIMGIVALRQ